MKLRNLAIFAGVFGVALAGAAVAAGEKVVAQDQATAQTAQSAATDAVVEKKDTKAVKVEKKVKKHKKHPKAKKEAVVDAEKTAEQPAK